MDDRRLEVVGIYSSLHVGRIQVGVDEPLKIGQAREIKVISVEYCIRFASVLRRSTFILFLVFSPQVVVHGSVPIQVDGEPWQQGGIATIIITHQGQSAMLKKVIHNEN